MVDLTKTHSIKKWSKFHAVHHFLKHDLDVKTSEYFTQIVKCFDHKCCSPYRSSYYHVIPSRFLPPPSPLIQVKGVLKVPEPNTVDAIAKFYVTFCFDLIAMEKLLPQNARVFPNNLYCPSLQPLLSSRMCSECGLYFATKIKFKKNNIKTASMEVS